LHEEREEAFLAVKRNDAKGCLLDAVTLHVVRRFKLETAVTAICGPIGVIGSTETRLRQKIYELKQRIDEPDMSVLWRDGQLYRQEATPAEKRAALEVLEGDAEWLTRNTEIIPAQGTKDPSPEVRGLLRQVGKEILDDVMAAQGSGRLLVCEDQMLRGLAQLEYKLQSTWLHPVLMRAADTGVMSAGEYLEAVVRFIDGGFNYPAHN
jgi:hypothetical protein